MGAEKQLRRLPGRILMLADDALEDLKAARTADDPDSRSKHLESCQARIEMMLKLAQDAHGESAPPDAALDASAR